MNMDNDIDALRYFHEQPATEELICEIGLNRKSRSCDRIYWPLYVALKKVFIERDEAATEELWEATSGLTAGRLWRDYLFRHRTRRRHVGFADLKRTAFNDSADEESLKATFFKIMHLFKIKHNLKDYYDLNRRCINTAGIILFRVGQLELDVIPACIFGNYAQELREIAFEPSTNLAEDCPMPDIISGFAVEAQKLLVEAGRRLGTEIASLDQLDNALEDERLRRFNALVRSRFPREKLCELLDWFKSRRDHAISEYLDCDATIPAIFEYITGIVWYTISGCRGRILEYMRLSLDANLLPVSHAAGGDADIVYRYPETPAYPAHVVLIEATLTEAANQRRAEMEPVSRHPGMFMLNNPDTLSYCVFVANFIDTNVVNDFRMRRNQPFYRPGDPDDHVRGMKIIPLSTDDLKEILERNLDYAQLYQIFEALHASDLRAHECQIELAERIRCDRRQVQ